MSLETPAEDRSTEAAPRRPSLPLRLPRLDLRFRWPFAALPSVFTASVVISGGGLRVVVTKGSEITFWQHVPLPAELLRHGWIADPAVFGAAMRDILARASVPTGRLLFALPGGVAIARALDIELNGKRPPAATIAREAAWAIPVTPEDYYLFWQAVGRPESNHVFAVAVQRRALDNLLTACARAKIRPSGVDLKPLALVRALGKRDAVIADVEGTGIEIVIVAGGMPAVMRALAMGDDPLDRVLVRDKLVEELSFALRLYDETNPASPLDPALPVYLTGEFGDGELAGSVARATRRPVVEPEARLALPPGFPAGRFMTNLGLLLK